MVRRRFIEHINYELYKTLNFLYKNSMSLLLQLHTGGAHSSFTFFWCYGNKKLSYVYSKLYLIVKNV